MIKKLIRYLFNGYLFSWLWCRLKGGYYTWRYVDSGGGRIVINRPFLKLHVAKERGARFVLDGDLILTSHCNSRGAVSIQLGQNSSMRVQNNFSLGQNNKIHVSPNGQLLLGGKVNELVSGITCDSMIMCFERIEIGPDLICGWNVYITDSDWHTTIKNELQQPHHAPVLIGNHCWIGSNVIVGKGTTLHDKVVVGAYTKLSNIAVSEGKTVVGMPPKVLTNTIEWSREL